MQLCDSFQKKKSGLPQEFAICDLKCNIEKRVNFRAYLEREKKNLFAYIFPMKLNCYEIPARFYEIIVFQTGPYNRTTSLYNQDPHCMVSNFADLLPMNSFAFHLCIQGLLDVREKAKSQETLK